MDVRGEALTDRPLSPRLSVYRWQGSMLASITHRLTGMLLVAFVPLYIWLLHGMLGAADDFQAVQVWMHSVSGRVVLWLVASALLYHMLNGVRFLCLDFGWGEGREVMLGSARLVLLAGVAGAMVFGVLLW